MVSTAMKTSRVEAGDGKGLCFKLLIAQHDSELMPQTRERSLVRQKTSERANFANLSFGKRLALKLSLLFDESDPCAAQLYRARAIASR